MKQILAVDIGGTNCRFAHFEGKEDKKISFKKSTWLKTEEAQSFAQLLEQLAKSDFSLKVLDADIVVIAAAGPVEKGVLCIPPLIDWNIDLTNAEKDFGIKNFRLVNDFFAQAVACRSPIASKAEKILTGIVLEDSAIAVVGAGTGLGKAVTMPDQKAGFVVLPSEGGHVNFTPQSRKEFEFQEYLVERLGGEYLIWNDVVSGRGLSHIHEFLTGDKLEPAKVAENFSENNETLKWYADFYGRVCRNYAFEVLALGGLYIAGGIAAKNSIVLKHEAFAHAFRSSYTHKDLLAKIPVFLINNEESGLWGAGYYGSFVL